MEKCQEADADAAYLLEKLKKDWNYMTPPQQQRLMQTFEKLFEQLKGLEEVVRDLENDVKKQPIVKVERVESSAQGLPDQVQVPVLQEQNELQRFTEEVMKEVKEAVMMQCMRIFQGQSASTLAPAAALTGSPQAKRAAKTRTAATAAPEKPMQNVQDSDGGWVPVKRPKPQHAAPEAHAAPKPKPAAPKPKPAAPKPKPAAPEASPAWDLSTQPAAGELSD